MKREEEITKLAEQLKLCRSRDTLLSIRAERLALIAGIDDSGFYVEPKSADQVAIEELKKQLAQEKTQRAAITEELAEAREALFNAAAETTPEPATPAPEPLEALE